MRTLLTAALLIALPCSALMAGELTLEQKKAARAVRLTRDIAECREVIAAEQKYLLGAEREGNAVVAARKRDNIARYQEKLSAAQLELSWLKGEVTLKTAEARVKAATDAVRNAEDAKAPEAQLAPLKAALAVAEKELAAIKALEAKGEF